MDYSVLKSGTDIRGVASDIFNNKVNLTDEAVKDITKAFVVWYVNKFSKSYNEMVMAVGHDSRITGPEISQKVIEALSESGVKVLDCGLSSTPAMFMTTVDLKTDAAIEITASHHPADRNGLKFFLPTGGLNASDISEIIELANSREEVISSSNGEIEPINYMEQYAARLRKMICDAVGKTEAEKPLKEYKIVVDAGNGVGGFYAKEVLEKLGADIKGSRFLEPDGMFPNHIPNPENETAMESICEAVVSSNADLGLIFDTDVDRAGCVGPDGMEINRNRLIALASYIATNGRKNAIVVTDSVTSDGLKKFIEEDLGCVHYRYRRGYKNVINKAVELNEKGMDCPIAIETSGHAALKENYFLDDGAYLVTKIVIELARGKNINELIKNLELPVEEKEIRFDINAENFKAYGEWVINEFKEYFSSKKGYVIASDNREGIRVSNENGWFLLRLSVHDPVMPMNFESRVEGGIKKEAEQLIEFFSKFALLNIETLKNI